MRLYTAFHLNLAYSSIEEEQRPEVIRHCYWPLLRLVRKYNLPLGIEASGYTLEVVAALDSAWLAELRRLTGEGPCEFIGSGYCQVSGPLVPALVNQHNQEIGLDVYERLIGQRPRIAFVSEQAYSAGLVQHYLDAGYEAIIMEWNNPRKCHPEWDNEWRYNPQRVCGPTGESIPIIWNDSIAFQKFQRYGQGEMKLDQYLNYLGQHASEDNRAFPLYGNDVEIFDFRPERYATELEVHKQGEWERIDVLFRSLMRDERFQLIPPRAALDLLDPPNAGNRIHLESSEQPIPVKKQQKYNVTRWALTGRNDLGINTCCYQIFESMKNSKLEPSLEDWKELCYLWSSDFRTHITERRWIRYLAKLRKLHDQWAGETNASEAGRDTLLGRSTSNFNNFRHSEDKRYLTAETDSIKCIFDKAKGISISKLWFKNISSEPLLGTLPHGHYDDISLGADFYSGHVIIERPSEHKITDLEMCYPEVVAVNGDGQVAITCKVENNGVRFEKVYIFYADSDCFDISISVLMRSRKPVIIRPLSITFIPASFDQGSLFYATHNGGRMIEKFAIHSKMIRHAHSISYLVSAGDGLGATEGLVAIGDEKSQLLVSHDQIKSALIPSVHYLPADNDQYFFRLQYSAQEIDETFVGNKEGVKLECCWRIASAATADIRTASTHLSSRIGGSISQMVGKGTRVRY